MNSASDQNGFSRPPERSNAAVHSAATDVEMRDLFMMFWRYRALIIFIVLAGVVMSAAVLLLVTPRYNARLCCLM